MLKFLCLISLVFFVLSEEKIGDTSPPMTIEELEKLDFPELEAILWKRGRTCKYCVGMYDKTDKHHLVHSCLEYQHLPIVTLKRPETKFKDIPKPPPPGSVPREVKKSDPAFEEIMYRMKYEEEEKKRKKEETLEMLKKQGFDVSRVQNEPDDFTKIQQKIAEMERKKYEEEKKKKEEQLKKNQNKKDEL